MRTTRRSAAEAAEAAAEATEAAAEAAGVAPPTASASTAPPAVFEAAALDGAGWWRRLWSITLPNITKVLGFVFIINVLYTFASLFGFVYVITAGGPGYETTTIDFLVYLRAFSGNNLGSGAALAVMLFLFIGVLTLLQNRVFKLQQED